MVIHGLLDAMENMSGVDLCNMMLSTYRIKQTSNKYYMHIIYYNLYWYFRHEFMAYMP